MKRIEYDNDGDIIKMRERKRWAFFGLPFTFTIYEVAERVLTIKTGFFTSVEDQIKLYRILDITYTRTLGQKMSGLGSIKISSSDKTQPEFIIKNIKHSREFKEFLDKSIERERLRNRIRTGELIADYNRDDDDDDDDFDDDDI